MGNETRRKIIMLLFREHVAPVDKSRRSVGMQSLGGRRYLRLENLPVFLTDSGNPHSSKNS